MKKIVSIVLALTMVFALSIPALASSYADVADGVWYAEAVEALREKEIMNGVGNGKFGPDETFTRAQLATVLYRMTGSPSVTGEDSFTDTEGGAWYADAVLWASQNKVVNGMGNGLFGTNVAATQEQLIVMLWRDAGAYVLDREKYASTDGVENLASDWAFDAVVWAKAEALIADLDAYAPTKAASRAQVADMVYRYMKLKEQFASVDAVSGATQKADKGSKVLVAYFSATGTTKGVAERLASAVGGDLYEIVPAEPYSDADLNWNDRESRSTKEQNDKSVRPGIASETLDLSSYTTIYVGFPIWWGEEPRILDTFVESYGFSGKTVIPFCTSGSSGIGSSGRNMEKLTSGATWLDGARLGGSVSEDELRAWADGLQ